MNGRAVHTLRAAYRRCGSTKCFKRWRTQRTPPHIFAAKGSASVSTMQKSARSRWWPALDSSTIIRSPLESARTDGRAGWIAGPEQNGRCRSRITGQELDGVKLERSCVPPRDQAGADQLARRRPGRHQRSRSHLFREPPRRDGTLCFDAESGLLVRLVRFTESPVGRVVTQTDYADYREVSGIKMPFRWTVAWLDGRSTFELTEVQPNIAVDGARFAKPAPGR